MTKEVILLYEQGPRMREFLRGHLVWRLRRRPVLNIGIGAKMLPIVRCRCQIPRSAGRADCGSRQAVSHVETNASGTNASGK